MRAHFPNSTKTPTYHRTLVRALLAVSVGLCCKIAAAQTHPDARLESNVTSLREADVIRLVRARSPAAGLANAQEGMAKARASTAGLRANPTLSWSRETVETGPKGSQDIISAQLPFDVSRPRVVSRLGAADAARLRSSAAYALDETVLETLLTFDAAVAAQQQMEVLQAALRNLEEAGRVLQRREAEGTASGYEISRLKIAEELLRSRMAEARGVLDGSKSEIAARLVLDPQKLRLVPEDQMLSEADATSLAMTHGSEREALKQATIGEQQAAQAMEQAEWAWIPTLELVGGMKRVSDLGGGVGYVVGVALDLPLFDHGQAIQTEAQAQRTVAKARLAALRSRMDADIHSALTRFITAEQELARFQREVATPLATLMVATLSGYREGELSLLELLDAQSTRTAVAERQVRLRAMAKDAELRLRSAAGDL